MGLTATTPEWYNNGAAFMGGYSSDVLKNKVFDH